MINKNDDLIKTEEAASLANLKPGTLVNWRCTKKQEIPYYKIGRRVFYKRSEIISWINMQRVS